MNKKKIAILTRRAGYNMGTSLQAVAMSQFIADAGYPNVIIDYDEYAGHLLWQLKPAVNRLILSAMNLCPMISRLLFRKKYDYLCRMQNQINSFREFEHKYMCLTSKRYRSIKTLRRDFSDYYACICGSDQIWSPYFYDPVFLLSFIKKGETCRKIAYAPSMGITDSSMLRQGQIDLMLQFDSISCREQEASAIASKITGQEITTVLDPTLMVTPDFWHKIANDVTFIKKEKYILTYFLHTDYYQDSIPYDYIQKLKDKTGFSVYNISLFNLVNHIDADINFDSIGPMEFLSLIKNAEWICTNSFHCCIFSYLFKRHFFVFERFMRDRHEGGNQNSRIHNLLKLFKLEQCITKPDDEPNISQEYDFNVGMPTITTERKKSLTFLNNALTLNKGL